MAQVNGPGPSPANLFGVVLSLPGDEAAITGAADESIGGVPGQTTQLNVDDGGTIGFSFDANSGSEVNITGGVVANNLSANPDSEINISGGTIGNGVRAFDSAVLNISGGDFGPRGFGILRSVSAEAGSVVNITGGEF